MNERQWREIAFGAVLLLAFALPQAASLGATVLLRIKATNPGDGTRDG